MVREGSRLAIASTSAATSCQLEFTRGRVSVHVAERAQCGDVRLRHEPGDLHGRSQEGQGPTRELRKQRVVRAVEIVLLAGGNPRRFFGLEPF